MKKLLALITLLFAVTANAGDTRTSSAPIHTPPWGSKRATAAAFDIRDYGAVCNGLKDDRSAIQAAANAANLAGGGEVLIPDGSSTSTSPCVFATPLTLNGMKNVTIRGVDNGRQSAGNGSTLKYTGTGSASAITLSGSVGVRISDVFIYASDAAFTGVLVDGSGATVGATKLTIDDATLGATAMTGAAAVLRLENAVNVQISNTVFTGGVYSIEGRTAAGKYSNVVNITNGCVFEAYGTAAIHNAGEAWTISPNQFQPGAGSITKALKFDATLGGIGTTFGPGNWVGDGTANNQVAIEWAGTGTIQGNNISFNSGTGHTGIKLVGATADLTIADNTIVTKSGTGIDFNSGAVINGGIRGTNNTIEATSYYTGALPCSSNASYFFVGNVVYGGGNAVPTDWVCSKSQTTNTAQYAVRSGLSAAQSIATGSVTAILFDTDNLSVREYDRGNLHSTSSNLSRFTIPTGGAGVWLACGQITWASSAAGTLRQLDVAKNGTRFALSHTTFSAATATAQSVCMPVVVSDGDYIEFRAMQDTGGALNVLGGTDLTWGSITKLY